MEELEKIKKAKSFLAELMMQRESSETNLILKNEKMKKDLFEAFCAAYTPSIKLKHIGFEKLEKINNFMRPLFKENISIYPESALYIDLVEKYSSGSFDKILEVSGGKKEKCQAIAYDHISIGLRILQTYEIIAPWLEEVNRCKIVKGLTEILEDEKC